LRKSNETGGGDIRDDYPTAGRWAGDRIVVVGDYDESGLYDLAKRFFKDGLYDLAKRFFKDISEEVKWDFNDFIGIEEMKVYASYEERLAVRLGNVQSVERKYTLLITMKRHGAKRLLVLLRSIFPQVRGNTVGTIGAGILLE